MSSIGNIENPACNMSTNPLIQVDVQNKRSFSKLGTVTVFLTDKIKAQLEGEITKSGENLFTLFGKGMALRGFKHLVETIREKEPHKKIVFTHEQTEATSDEIRISYDDYKKSASDKFFTFYRETGLEAAAYYLNFCFPDKFEYDKTKVTQRDLKQIDKNFSKILETVPKKRKNQKALIDQTSKVIDDLTKKKRLLKQEVEDLEKIRNKSNIFFFQSKLDELKQRFTKKYHETRGKNSWQRWIYANNWLFGINYQPPIEKQKINISGSMPDYSFPTMDGFLDILEIKLPTMDVITPDSSHVGSYTWSSDTNKAIGQVVTYLSEIELYQLHLKEEIKRVYRLDLYLIKPRSYILIGNKDGWSKDQHKALRKLNYSLHGIEVISYTDLIQRGKEIVESYTKNYNVA